MSNNKSKVGISEAEIESAKKRKDAPIETPEDQLEELEDRLFSEVTRARREGSCICKSQ